MRAPGSRAARTDYMIAAPGLYQCVQYAASHGVPDEVLDNADDPLQPDRTAVEFVTDKLMLRKELEVATNVNTAANWTNSGTPTNGQWNSDTSDPIADVVGGSTSVREVIRQAIGRFPNTCVMGATVFAALKRHPDILDRIKYTQKGIVTADLMAELFEIDKLVVGTAIYNTAKEGATGSYSDIWGKYVWFGWVAPSPALEVPSAGYVFEWKNRTVNRYREMEEHQDVVECLEQWDTKVTSADSGYLLTSVVA